MAALSLQKHINKQLYDKWDLAYLYTDKNLKVVEVSDGLTLYGYPEIPLGCEVEDYVDFMVGFDASTRVDLPLVESPSGITVAVNLIPSKRGLAIVFSNASHLAEQRQLLQQKANENELLLRQQRILTHRLEQASKELEGKNEALREAARLQNSFLSGVSHEFRTPLSSIIGYTNLLERETHNPDKNPEAYANCRSYLRAVKRSSKHILSLVENLLDHGKLDADQIVIRPKPCDLHEVFDDIRLLLSPLAGTKNVEFTLQTNFEPGCMVIADDSRLRQCLLNIVGNAVKFTDKGSVTLKAELNRELLSIEVIDTGEGISKDNLAKIRIPFFQVADTGKAGTGLGLTITEGLIELMGGELVIRSELHQGTQVSFELPMPLLEAEALAMPEPSIDIDQLKVLLAEDDSDIADLLVMLLDEQNIEVTHVANGALALEASEHEQFDLILMDLHMPVMDGYQAMEAMQKGGNTVPVAVMSASNLSEDRLQAQQYGCAAYLTKPVEIEEILLLANQLTSEA